MKRQACITLSSIHVLALAVSTYVANIDIMSILVTGWICSFTGIALGISARKCKKFLLVAVGISTPILAVVLVVAELGILQMGPGKAALPFCIIFIIYQVFATLIILVQLTIFDSAAEASTRRITIKTGLVSMLSVSVFFAIVRHLLEFKHNGLMLAALTILGLTFVGLGIVLYGTAFRRDLNKVTLPLNGADDDT